MEKIPPVRSAPPQAHSRSMKPEIDLPSVRRAYAKNLLFAAQVADARVEAAFADVPREEYLPPGPWTVVRIGAGNLPTPSADPVYLYTDCLVALVPEQHINNGQPSLHVQLMASMEIRQGEHVVHVGAGLGYYTAILAHLVGGSGRVTAIELHPDLAAGARANLSHLPNVSVIQGDATAIEFDPADAIYVSGGMSRPPTRWVDHLKEGGRLLAPLSPVASFMPSAGGTFDHASLARLARASGVFRIRRVGDAFEAHRVCFALFIPIVGAGDAESDAALAAAMETGNAKRVTKYYRRDDIPAERVWLRGAGWCFAFD